MPGDLPADGARWMIFGTAWAGLATLLALLAFGYAIVAVVGALLIGSVWLVWRRRNVPAVGQKTEPR